MNKFKPSFLSALLYRMQCNRRMVRCYQKIMHCLSSEKRRLENAACHFEIDYVVTWVNHEDKLWQSLYNQYQQADLSDDNNLGRYYNKDELKYQLRSLDKYAPWIRTIYIVSNCAPPLWLNLDNPKICWVDHAEIFSAEELPTFNSHAIESKLHKIPGLSEHFIYSNDDCFLARTVNKEDFFLANGVSKIRLERKNHKEVSRGNKNTHYSAHINAAITSQYLLKEKTSIHAVKIHTHSPKSLKKEVLQQLETLFLDAFKQVGSSKFRHMDDISVTSFLYHHYAYYWGQGVLDYTPTLFISVRRNYMKKLLCLRLEKHSIKYLSFCINDGHGSHEDTHWKRQTLLFFQEYFPSASAFEK